MWEAISWVIIVAVTGSLLVPILMWRIIPEAREALRYWWSKERRGS